MISFSGGQGSSSGDAFLIATAMKYNLTIITEEGEKQNKIPNICRDYGIRTVNITELSLLVVPEQLDGYPVTTLASGAFRACPADAVILPKSLLCIEEDALFGAALSELCFFDNLERFSDASFTDCQNLSTLRINAIEDPYGYSFRRESVLADKYDLLILTGGQNRLIFYGGCSMWYNLIGEDVKACFGNRYSHVHRAIQK